jgi:prevent-host-death family protein
MPRIISALTARTQFGQILKRASQKDERFVVGRRGEPQVVIMGINDYLKTFAPPPKFLKAIWSESKIKGLNKLSLREVNAEIAAFRQERQKQPRKPSK